MNFFLTQNWDGLENKVVIILCLKDPFFLFFSENNLPPLVIIIRLNVIGNIRRYIKMVKYFLYRRNGVRCYHVGIGADDILFEIHLGDRGKKKKER